jgi:4-amino-4-deoxy-L-arabinose transferase-like glycosyltransferase
MPKASLSAPAAWTLSWAVLVAVALALRPLLPIDETRYLSVAWEMWLRGDFLVPHLNGEVYSHKPPLLFWLMNASWAVFGVNDITPRLVAPLFGLAALFLTARIAARLWPGSAARMIAPLLLVASVFWALFSTLTMFDMLMATWTLIAMHGLIDTADGRALRGWAQVALAIGLGVLSKGPVILVYVLPPALAAPWWITSRRPHWGAWYGGLLASIVAGALIALAWAIPAGLSGGEAYRNAIFWGQSAGRMVESFAHRQPFWWYVPILPALLLPWLLWPTVWRATRRLARGRDRADMGLRLAAVWVAGPFVILSAFSGKAPHYLLPVLPALALVAARGLDLLPDAPRARRLATPLAMLSTLAVVVVHLAAEQRLHTAHDIKLLSLQLAALQREGYALAYFGNYHGQFQFLGRMAQPIVEIGTEPTWLNVHPKSKVISYHYTLPAGATPDLVQRYRGGVLALWDSAAVRANPTLVHRGPRNPD